MSATASASRTRLGPASWRYVLLLHRYLGIALGLLVLLWCTSGIVMMYVQYPALDRTEQLAGLTPLDPTTSCCSSSIRTGDGALTLAGWRVESAGGLPLLRATLPDGMPLAFDLVRGARIERWTAAALDANGASVAARNGHDSITARAWVDRDQWTVHARFNVHRPLRKLTDSDGNEWYVSSRTGDVVQATSARERFWNWPGAVTHWIYPTMLRQHTGAWAQVVIWLTIVSLFLTVTGVAVGIRDYRWRRGRRRSPYRGWRLWHHYTGLVFGLMTLIWLGSGLLSMNPWGVLEGRSIDDERRALNGLDQTLDEAVSSVRAVLPLVPPGTVRLEAAPWLGTTYFLAWTGKGDGVRLSETGPVPPVALDEASQGAARLTADPMTIDLLAADDPYYFTHHERMEFPVYRIVTEADERFYLSALSGQLLTHYDRDRRWFRWLFDGLHRGDFHPLLRARPLWDVIMLVLLGGVTLGVATGVYLAWQRIKPG